MPIYYVMYTFLHKSLVDVTIFMVGLPLQNYRWGATAAENRAVEIIGQSDHRVRAAALSNRCTSIITQ